MKKEEKIVMMFSLIIAVLFATIASISWANKSSTRKTVITKVNLSELTYEKGEDSARLTVYTQDDFESFLKAYKEGNLPEIYITNFLFDGVGMHKTYDLDDFIDNGNETQVSTLELTVLNVYKGGKVELTGELTGGMIAINSNVLESDLTLVLNGVKIDTDSKKAPVIYVYNKDKNDTSHKVTIEAKEGTENYLEGGKLKKVSLIPSEELSNYKSKYSGESLTNYEAYSNYYGVYTKAEIENILFATVTADNEDLQDGDPLYFYKASGAISSDIDLYFEGSGYLKVVSKNKEGIETKGNLTFDGGIGDYVIEAQDDCLNTTTSSEQGTTVRNDLTIDVNSLYAIVSLEADEGDAIDSNGMLTINGGTIIALAKPGQDAGLDSQKGTYINGGTILATGDMYDQIQSDSKQNFLVLSFGTSITENTLVTLLDESEKEIFAYKTDRTYQSLVYSSASLKEGNYTLYKDGEITGIETNGFYTEITNYTKGTRLGYSSTGSMRGGMPGQMEKPDGEIPEKPDGEIPEKPDGEIPEMPGGTDQSFNGPMPDSEISRMGPGEMIDNGNTTASNGTFTISGIANLFSGIATYTE